ncbi:MAG: HAMP domain-containing protein [Nanobdellota archaeon]
MKIKYKLLALLLILTVVPLAILGYTSTNDISRMGSSAVDGVNNMKQMAVEDSTNSLKELGERIIKQKAVDTAKQLEVYIKQNPEMTVEELQEDPKFSELAVQPVGDTGYTAITDVDSLVCRFHSKEKTVDMDLHKLEEKLPGFFDIMSASQGGKVSKGYYDWEEPDGSIREKYMHIAPVDARTADGVQFSVAATTYIDEFSSPVKETKEKIEKAKKDISEDIEYTSDKVRSQTINFLVIIMILVIIVGILFANSLTRPINKLTKAGGKIADGDLDTEIPQIKTKDEVQELGTTMNMLVGALKFMKKEKSKDKSKKGKK